MSGSGGPANDLAEDLDMIDDLVADIDLSDTVPTPESNEDNDQNDPDVCAI